MTTVSRRGLERAVPPVPRRRGRRDHFIVCGDNALACRVVEELSGTYGEEVTVLLRSRDGGHGPRMAGLPRVRIIERAELDSEAFSAAQVQSARSVALRQDDLGNFHAASPGASPRPASSGHRAAAAGKTWASPTMSCRVNLFAGLPWFL